MYKVERYADSDGREIEMFVHQPKDGETAKETLFKCMVPVLTDQGIQPIPYVMNVTNLEEAFASHDKISEDHIARIKSQIEEIRRKQQNKLVVAQNVPPTKPNGGLVLSQ